MSNHTNNKILYHAKPLNRHVGGAHEPLLQNKSDYINEQTNILDSGNKLLSPHHRFGHDIHDHQDSRTSSTSHKTRSNAIGNQQNSSGTNAGVGGLGFVTDTGSELDIHTKDVYLRGDSFKYDPHEDFLYKRGLMSDGHQRRRIKTTYLNIDSRFRNTKPSIFTDPAITLEHNPLKFTKGSDIMFINHRNHILVPTDQITLTGASTSKIVLRTFRDRNQTMPTIIIPSNCNVMKVFYEHGINLDYRGDNIQVAFTEIKGDKGSNVQSTFLGTIPVNILNNTHTVRLTVTDLTAPPDCQIEGVEINCSVEDIKARHGADFFTCSDQHFFVILPVNMVSRDNSDPAYVLSDYNFNLRFDSIGGVNLNLINAVYPITVNNLNGFHTIINIYDNGYDIRLDAPALDTVRGGGNFTKVARITSVLQSYPDPHKYRIGLGNVFHNILSVRLVSTEFPNSDKVVRDNISGSNNKIYWNNIDDGDYLYSINVPSGNYSTNDLVIELQNLFSATPRINAQDEELKELLNISYTEKHFMQVVINENTGEVIFKLFKEFIVDRPIVQVDPNIASGQNSANSDVTYKLTINHPNHGMTFSGQTILIQNAIAHLGIPSSIINGSHRVETITGPDQYIIELPKFNLIQNATDTGGGINVFIYVPDQFRLRFDQPDTIGTLLGFRLAGEQTSITNFGTEISNQDKYFLETEAQEVNFIGQTTNFTNNALQLSGGDYVLMVAEPLKTMSSIGPIKDVFSKIILCDAPGRILYNTFVPTSHIFDDPLESLFELDIRFYNPNGTFYNFNGLNHSYTLEITTIVDIPEGSGISASTGKNYNREIR